MKYMGGKSKIAKEIVPIIQRHIEARGTGKYVEPFVGGANIIDKVECESRMGLDINRYLIALFNHIQSGGELPQTITREEYSKVRAARDQYPDWYVGCVGFLASYNGRFFDGGYSGTVKTKTGLVRDYYNEARNNLLQQSAHLQGVSFGCSDYRELEFENCVIYCDPPYSGTKQYNNTRFNSSEFWELMRRWSENNTVLISEQTAPTPSAPRKNSLSIAGKEEKAMKIKTLAALCKKAGVFYLYDRITDNGEIAEQWLGTGVAIFPLHGLPYMQENNLFTLFDITDKQQEKIYFRHEQLPTKAINFEDMDPNENILDREKLTIGHAGKVLRPLQTRRGLVFIDTAQLQPLADLVDTLELYERETEAGGTYIAAKSGFMLVGVIMPYNIVEKGFVEQVESLAKQCRVAFEAKERARAVAAEDQQQTTII